MTWLGAVVGVTALVLAASGVHAQDLEPRAYANTPVGLNFLIAGYAYSEGGVTADPSVPLEDANIQIHTSVLAYVRSLDVWGKSGKFDVVLPIPGYREAPRSRASPTNAMCPGLAIRGSVSRSTSTGPRPSR
jgi:hypothetical protein